MRLLAVVKNPLSIARYLAAVGELTEVPGDPAPRSTLLEEPSPEATGAR